VLLKYLKHVPPDGVATLVNSLQNRVKSITLCVILNANNGKIVLVTPCIQIEWLFYKVTGQLADKPTRGQSSRGLVNSRTSQLAEMFDLFEVFNSSKCYFRQITLFIRCQYSIGLELGLRLGLMYR